MAKKISNIMNVNPGGNYENFPKEIPLHKEILEKLNGIIGNLEGYDMTLLNEANPFSDFNRAAQNIDTALDIMENGGNAYAIDIETIGDVFGEKSSDKTMFGITEVGMSSKSYKRNALGQIIEGPKKQEFNFLFGLQSGAENEARALIGRAQTMPWNSFSELEKSSMERMARAAHSIQQRGDGFFEIVSGELKYDPRSVRDMSVGLDRLLEVDRKQGINTDIGRKRVQKIRDMALESSTGRNFLAGHNAMRFDFPIMTEGMGIKYGKNLFDPYDAMDAMNYDPDEYYKKFPNGSKVKSHYMKQVSLAEGAGLNVIQAHTAVADTDTLIDVISNKVLLKDLKNKSTEIQAAKKILKASDPVFRVESSISRKKIGSTGFSMDFRSILDPTTGKEEILGQQDWILNKGRYYEIQGISKIDQNFIKQMGDIKGSEEIARAISENKDLYAMKVMSKAKGSREYATIIRSSTQEFEQILGANVRVASGVSQNVINAADKAYSADAARREWQGFFQIGEGGHDRASKYYGAFEDFNKEYASLGGKGTPTKEQLEDLVTHGSIKLPGGELKTDSALGKLSSNKGISFSRKRNFVGMYDVLADTNEVFSPILEEIENNIRDNGNLGGKVSRNRTLAAQVAFNKIGESIGLEGIFDQNGNFSKGVNSVSRQMSPSDFSYIPLPGMDGSIGRVNASQSKKLSGSIYSEINKAAIGAEFGINVDIAKKKRMNELVEYYMDNVLLEGSPGFEEMKGVRSRLRNGHTDFNNMSKTMSSVLNREVSDLLQDVTPEELSNIDRRIDALKSVSSSPRNDAKRYKLERLKSIQDTVADQSMFSMEGFKLNGQSVNQIAKAKGLNSREIARLATSHDLIGGVDLMDMMTTDMTGGVKKTGMNKVMMETLGIHLGYGEEELGNIEHFMRKVNDHNYNNKKDALSVSLNRVSKGDSEQFFFSVVRKDKFNSMTKSLAKGELYEGALNAQLPSVNESSGLKYVSKNKTKRANTQSISFYVAKADKENAGKIIMKKSTVSGEALSALNKGAEGIIHSTVHLDDVAGQSRRLNRSISRPINNASGFTGNEIYRNADGYLESIFMPNAGDFAKSGDIDITGLMNLTPVLYKEDKEFAGIIDKLMLDRADQGSKVTERKMNEWFTGIMSGDSRAFKDYDDMDGVLKEYMTTMMFHGKEIGKEYDKKYDGLNTRIIDRVANLNMIKNANNLEVINSIKRANQIMKETDVSKGMATLTNYTALNTWGVYSDHNRPPQVQATRYHSIFLENMGDAKISELESKGIFMGRSIVDTSMKDLVYDKVGKSARTQVETGFSGITRAMTEEEIYKNMDLVFNDNLTKEIMAVGGIDDLAQAQRIAQNAKMSLYRQASTTEQGSLSHPAVRDIYQTTNMETFGFDPIETTLDPKIKQGSYVKTNDVIGSYKDKNGISQELRYNKKDGIIQNVSDGGIDILPSKGSIGENKLIVNATEKSLSKVYEIEGMSNTDTKKLGAKKRAVEELIYGRNFGKGTTLVAAFDIVKHESTSSILGGDIDFMAQKVLSGANEQEIEAFRTVFGQSFGSLDMKATELRKGSKYQKKIFTIDQMGAKDNIYTAYESFMANMQNSGNENFREIYKEMENTFFEGGRTGRRKAFNSFISFGQMNAQFSSQYQGEGPLQRGVKSTYNSRQTFGTSFGGDYKDVDKFRTFTNNGYERSIQDILDREFDEVLSSKDAVSGRKDLRNILESTKLNMGETSNARIKTLNLSEINIPSGGIDAEDIGETMYGKYKDYDVIKVIMPDEMDVNDYFSPIGRGKKSQKVFGRTNSVYLPIQTYGPAVEGEIYKTSQTMKSSADFITAAKALQEGKGGRLATVRQMKQRIEDALVGIHNSVNYEFNNKDGIMMSKVMSARMNYSGYEAIGAIYAPIFDANGEMKNKALTGFMRQDFGGEKRLIDAAWMSEQAFTRKAGDDIFERVGKQLVEGYDADFLSEGLRKEFLSMGDNVPKANYEELGKKYLAEVGLPGSVVRFPAFMPDSEQLAFVRLDRAAKSDSIGLVGWLAAKMNGDTDGDTVGAKLFLEKTDGGPRMYGKNSKIMKAFSKGIEGQSILNEQVVKNLRADATKMVDNIRPKTADAFKIWRDKNAKEGFSYLQDLGITYSAANTRYNKIAVGLASNPNKYIRDVAGELYNTSIAGLKAQKDITDFTTFTEENIISIKHLKDPSRVIGNDRMGLASDYYKSVTQMTEGNVDGGFKRMLGQITQTGFFEELGDPNDIKQDKLFERITTSNLDDLTDRERQARRIYDFFNEDGAKELMRSPNIKSGNMSVSTDMDTIREITKSYTSADGRNTEMSRQKIKSLNYEGKISNESLSKYYSGIEGNYQVVDSGIGDASALSYATLEDLDTSARKTIYGGDESSVARRLSGDMNGYREVPSQGFPKSMDSESFLEVQRQRQVVSRAANVASSRNFDIDHNQVLSDYNDEIRRRAKNLRSPSDVSSMTEDYIRKVYGRAGIEGAAGVKLRGMAESGDYALDRAVGIMDQIEGVRMYDMDVVNSNLTEIALSEVKKVHGPSEFRDEFVTRIKVDSMANYTEADAIAKETLTSAYGELVGLGEAGREALDWTDSNNLLTMGKQRMAAGDFVGARLEDLDLETLRDFMIKEDSSQAFSQTQERVGRYLNALDSIKPEDEAFGLLQEIKSRRMNTENFMSSSMDLAVDSDKTLRDVNDAIRQSAEDSKAAKKTLDSSTESIAKNFNMKDNKNVKVAIGVALALGVASIATGQFTSVGSSISPTKRPNGMGSPDAGGNYADRPAPGSETAPPSEQSFRAQSGSGVNFKVKGTMNPNLSNANISRAAGTAIAQNGNFNINVNSRDQSNIDQGWLERQFSNLL